MGLLVARPRTGAPAPAIIRAFHVNEAVVAAGTPFLRVVMLGVPAAAVLFVVVAGLRGAGDTRTPLAIGAVVGVLNVGLAYVLIFGRLGLPALGVAGAATATALAFVAGATLGVVLLARGRLVLRLHVRPYRLRADVVRRVLTIGVPAAVEHLLMQVGFFVYIVFAATRALRRSDCAARFCARVRAPRNVGSAMAIRMPMIRTTTISSMRVKPSSSCLRSKKRLSMQLNSLPWFFRRTP